MQCMSPSILVYAFDFGMLHQPFYCSMLRKGKNSAYTTDKVMIVKLTYHTNLTTGVPLLSVQYIHQQQLVIMETESQFKITSIDLYAS